MVRGEVFCLHLPSRARHSLMSVREINYEQNRLATNEICKVTWRVRVSVLIRPIPAIRPYLVALVIGVVLAIVGIPTRLSRLRRMTTATHECVGNFDMAKRSCERNCASVVKPTSFLGSFRLSASVRIDCGIEFLILG